MNAKIDTETAAQFVSMRLASYGNLPFQILSPTLHAGKIGVRLHPDEQYCIVDAVGVPGLSGASNGRLWTSSGTCCPGSAANMPINLFPD